MARFKLEPDGAVRDSDHGRFIPPKIENRFWVDYLAWLDEGNTPDPADTPQPPTSDADRAEFDILRSPALLAIVRLLGDKPALNAATTEAAVIAAIKAQL